MVKICKVCQAKMNESKVPFYFPKSKVWLKNPWVCENGHFFYKGKLSKFIHPTCPKCKHAVCINVKKQIIQNELYVGGVKSEFYNFCPNCNYVYVYQNLKKRFGDEKRQFV